MGDPVERVGPAQANSKHRCTRPLQIREQATHRVFLWTIFVVICEGYGISADYSFLDVHARSFSHTNAARWNTIEINTPNVLMFAFASELSLAVAILCVSMLPSSLSHLGLCSIPVA